MWLLPSLHRLERLAACLAAIRSAGCSTPGIVILGADQSADLAAVAAMLPPGWQVVTQHPDDKSLVAVMNRFVRDHAGLAWYGFLQDDLIVHTPCWDVRLIAAAGAAGMASSNDLWQAPKRMTAATVYGGDLIRAFGFWCPSEFEHCYQDDFWEDVGRRCGNWSVLMDVVAEHVHAFNGKAAKDATYAHGYAPMERDRMAWECYRGSKAYADLLNRVGVLCGLSSDQSRRMRRARSRSVLICVPIARAPTWQFSLALAETCLMFERLGIKFAIRAVIGSSNLPRARNELCARFLASEFTDLLFVDDDMGWQAESALRLLASEQELIAGVGRKRVDKPNTDQDVWCVAFEDDVNENLVQDDAGAVRVKRVGTGFMKIARSALEKMIAAHPEWKRRGHSGMNDAVKARYYQFFRFDPDDADEMGEDYVFCDRWRALGGSVWIDPQIALTHVGEKSYSGAICEMMTPADDEPQREAAE